MVICMVIWEWAGRTENYHSHGALQTKTAAQSREVWVPRVLSSGLLEAVYSDNNDGRTGKNNTVCILMGFYKEMNYYRDTPRMVLFCLFFFYYSNIPLSFQGESKAFVPRLFPLGASSSPFQTSVIPHSPDSEDTGRLEIWWQTSAYSIQGTFTSQKDNKGSEQTLQQRTHDK